MIDEGSWLNFPNTNELDVTGGEEGVIKEADVVLAIDVPDLEELLTRRMSSQDRRAATILEGRCKGDTNRNGRLSYSGWSADYRRLFPTDLSVTSTSSVAIAALVAKCSELQEPQMASAYRERRVLCERDSQETPRRVGGKREKVLE